MSEIFNIKSISQFHEILGLPAPEHPLISFINEKEAMRAGKSIKEHIDSYTIRRAKSVLLNSNSSISEIAYGLGFEYPQSFTRMFKKKTGISLNEYRMLN